MIDIDAYFEDPLKYSEEIQKSRYYCKCGHSAIIPKSVQKQICSFCGNYIYTDKKLEFREKFKQYLKSRK